MHWDYVLRLVVAGILGGLIGWNREYRAKEAGLRTHFLVAIGSALIMIVSQHGFADVLAKPGFSIDPSRVAAQVVSGIGFIGVGTILVQKHFVKGLTTAVGLWATAGIGLAVGGGMYWLGLCAMILILIGFELLTIMFKNVCEHNSLLVFSTTNKERLKQVMDELHKRHYRITSYDMQHETLNNEEVLHITLVLKSKNKLDESELFLYIQEFSDITLKRLS